MIDDELTHSKSFQDMIAQNCFGLALISTLINTVFPGTGSIILDLNVKYPNPIYLGDDITATIKVINKHTEDDTILLECNCLSQFNQIVIYGEIHVKTPKEKFKRIRNLTTNSGFKENNLYQKLLEINKASSPLVTAVIHPVDELSLKGAIAAAKEKIIIPIFVGPQQKILKMATSLGIDLTNHKIIPTKHSHEAADVGVQMAKSGEVEAIMKGKLHTDELMSAVVNKQTGLRTGRRMSHIFAIDVPNYKKPLFLTDAALNLFPHLEEKIDIVQNAIDLFSALGFGTPKVAILSAAETVNDKIPSTLDAAALCKMSDRGQILGGILDGPLAFDNAISLKSAQIKGIKSNVAGDADIIVVPDIESGNILYKQMTYLSGMEAAGLVMGASVPIILTSRGSDETSRKASCLMALAYLRKKKVAILDD